MIKGFNTKNKDNKISLHADDELRQFFPKNIKELNMPFLEKILTQPMLMLTRYLILNRLGPWSILEDGGSRFFDNKYTRMICLSEDANYF